MNFKQTSLFCLSVLFFIIFTTNGFTGYELGNFIGFTSERPMSYEEASLYCSIQIHTSLATITNNEDNQDAVSVAFATSGHGKPGTGPSPGYVWFGLNDKDNDKKYSFIDGITEFNEYTSYNAFISGTPDKTDNVGHCVALLAEPGFNRWHDFRCDGSEGEVRGFVCNKPN